jgi:hypothetical protein
LNDRAPFPHGTVPQAEIDRVLIGHPQLSRQFLEVVQRRGIEVNGDLALELRRQLRTEEDSKGGYSGVCRGAFTCNDDYTGLIEPPLHVRKRR